MLQQLGVLGMIGFYIHKMITIQYFTDGSWITKDPTALDAHSPTDVQLLQEHRELPVNLWVGGEILTRRLKQILPRAITDNYSTRAQPAIVNASFRKPAQKKQQLALSHTTGWTKTWVKLWYPQCLGISHLMLKTLSCSCQLQFLPWHLWLLTLSLTVFFFIVDKLRGYVVLYPRNVQHHLGHGRYNVPRVGNNECRRGVHLLHTQVGRRTQLFHSRFSLIILWIWKFHIKKFANQGVMKRKGWIEKAPWMHKYKPYNPLSMMYI